ncbi:unnamed protein product [Rhizophagus irregularis]|nr:unnamed protein product [Rhizophagus irregularis]
MEKHIAQVWEGATKFQQFKAENSSWNKSGKDFKDEKETIQASQNFVISFRCVEHELRSDVKWKAKEDDCIAGAVLERKVQQQSATRVKSIVHSQWQ